MNDWEFVMQERQEELAALRALFTRENIGRPVAHNDGRKKVARADFMKEVQIFAQEFVNRIPRAYGVSLEFSNQFMNEAQINLNVVNPSNGQIVQNFTLTWFEEEISWAVTF